MKVEIDAKGIMIIESETPLESYAIRKWCDENPLFPNVLFIYTSGNNTEQTKV